MAGHINLLAALLLVPLVSAASPQEDYAEPYRILARANQTLDPSLAASAYATDSALVFEYPGQPVETFRGREPIRSSYVRTFGQVDPDAPIKLQFRFQPPGLASDHQTGVYRVDAKAGGRSVTVYGRFAVKLVKENGSWRFAEDRGTPAAAPDFDRLPAISLGTGQPVQAEAARTLTGIPLDAPWKRKLYGFAREKLRHPAWGWTHSERNFRLASEIAKKEGLTIDTDILFAASFTHDIGAISEFQKEGADHADRSVEIAEPLLREAGFPVEKLPAVREAILGHMHDKEPGNRGEAIVLHDADTLDFLGSVGVARRLAVTGTAPDYVSGVARIREYADKLPGRLVTRSAKSLSVPRVAEMRAFLDRLKTETADGRLP